MRAGFSLLLYGFGSKRAVLEVRAPTPPGTRGPLPACDTSACLLLLPAQRFRETAVGGDHAVIVHGFHPQCSLKEVVQLVSRAGAAAGADGLEAAVGSVNSLLDKARSPPIPPEPCSLPPKARYTTHTHTHTHRCCFQCRVIARAFEGAGGENDPRLFLLVHSLCGAGLRSAEAQEGIAQLAAAPRIHLAASVDHVHAAFLWPQHLLQRFNWVRTALSYPPTRRALNLPPSHLPHFPIRPILVLCVSSTRTPPRTSPTGAKRRSLSRWWRISRSRGRAGSRSCCRA